MGPKGEKHHEKTEFSMFSVVVCEQIPAEEESEFGAAEAIKLAREKKQDINYYSHYEDKRRR